MSVRRGISAEASTALSTSYTVLTLDGDTSGDAAAKPVPDQCLLAYVIAVLDTTSSATAITWYLAADSGGDVPLTREVTSDILAGKTTATDGSVVMLLDVDYVRTSAGTAGALYLVAKTTAGTANCTPRLIWREDL